MPISPHSRKRPKTDPRFSTPPSRSPQGAEPEVNQDAREARTPDYDTSFTRFLAGAMALAASLAPHSAGASEAAVEQTLSLEPTSVEAEIQSLLNPQESKKRTRRGTIKRTDSGEFSPRRSSSGRQAHIARLANVNQNFVNAQIEELKALDNSDLDRDPRPGRVDITRFTSYYSFEGRMMEFNPESGEVNSLHLAFAKPLETADQGSLFEAVHYLNDSEYSLDWYREIKSGADPSLNTSEELNLSENKNGSIRYEYITEKPR